MQYIKRHWTAGEFVDSLQWYADKGWEFVCILERSGWFWRQYVVVLVNRERNPRGQEK